MKLQIALRSFAKDTLYFIAGSILYALGLYTFALGAGFAPGGVSGVSIIINHFTGLPIGVLALALNLPLILLCGRIIGLTFLVKSIWTMLLSTLFLDVIFPLLPTYSGNPLLAAMFTGVLVGAGLAIIYMRGSSTGGTDFLTMAIKKKKPHFSVGQISLVLDGVVILIGGLVYQNVDAVLYGIISSFAATITMDNVLYCACSKSELYKVRTAAHSQDPDCLIMITEASELFGEGFEPPLLPGNETPPSQRTSSEE